MGLMKTVAAVACSAMLLTSAPSATAQTTPDRLTFVTFSGPVSIPGKTLPAGTYAFRLADSPADRHIVQVFDKEQSKLYATLLAVPADRVEAEGDPVITFKETPSDRPPAVRYWYYAGERSGNEFVYPKNQAMLIAKASGDSVMSVDTDSTDFNDWKNSQTSRVSGNAEPQSGSTASTASTTAASDTTTSASQPPASSQTSAGTQPMTTPPATTAEQTPQSTAPSPSQAPASQPTTVQPTTADAKRPVGTSGRSASELPRTASELPAVGMIGLFALAGALVLRVRRRATA